MAKKKTSRRSFAELTPITIPRLEGAEPACFTACGTIKTEDEQLIEAAKEYRSFQFAVGSSRERRFVRITLSESVSRTIARRHLHIDVASPAYFRSPPAALGDAREAVWLLERLIDAEVAVAFRLQRTLPLQGVKESPLIKVEPFTKLENVEMRTSGLKYQFRGTSLSEFEWELVGRSSVKVAAEIRRDTRVSGDYLQSGHRVLQEAFTWFAFGGPEHASDDARRAAVR